MAAVILAIVLTFNRIDRYTMHGDSIAVPQVFGLNDTIALMTLDGYGLEGYISDIRFDEDFPANCVIEQVPTAGSFVKKGRHIYLTINSGNRPLIAIPDVADNSSRRSAEFKIQGAGFQLTEPILIEGEKDWVYKVLYDSCEIEPGTKIPQGSILTLVIGGAVPQMEVEDADTIDQMLDPLFFESGINPEFW